MMRLSLPAGSRAAELLARLDSRFFRFVEELPHGIRGIAVQKGTYAGTACTDPFGGMSAMNPGITCSPWLFWELVQDLDDASFMQLAEAGSQIVIASVLLDHLVDGQALRPGETFLLHQALYRRGVSGLRAAFPSESAFWSDFDRLGCDHVGSLSAELEARSDPHLLRFERFQSMVPGKLAPTIMTMAAFTRFAGRPELLGPIESSIRHLAVAAQLLDDIGDWQKDLENGQLTYFLAQLKPEETWLQSPWPSLAELQHRMDVGWQDIWHLRMVQRWVEKSIEAVAGLNCRHWARYVDDHLVIAEQHLERCLARHLVPLLESILQPSEQP